MHGTLALLWRSIRADAIQRRSHAFRIGSVLLILVMLLASHVAAGPNGVPGLIFFRNVSFLMAGLVTLAAMGHFATAITEEKEEGTLGLLLLADISPLSILLGKSTNRIFSALLIFAAQFPFALLALALGGITIGQIVCTYAALSAYMFLMANLALLMSVMSSRTGNALAAMIAVTILMNGFAPAFDVTVNELVLAGHLYSGGAIERWADWLLAWQRDVSIFHELERILQPGAERTAFNAHNLIAFVAGCGAFFVSWLVFKRIVWAADLSSPPRPVATRRRVLNRLFAFRPWRLPLVWKDYYFLAGGPVAVVIKLAVYPVAWLVLYLCDPWVKSVTDVPVHHSMFSLLLTVLAGELVIYAAQLFHLEQKWGTLPTLLMLPKNVAQISYAKVFGCLLASAPTLLGLALLVWADPASSMTFMENGFGHTNGIALGCALLILCQLTVLCSLVVKWGALPLAAALLLIVGTVASPFIAAGLIVIRQSYPDSAEWVQYGPFLYVTGIVSVVIQLLIAQRVHVVAGE